MIGVDAPAYKSFLDLISKMCADNSFTNYRVLAVPKSDKWNFQLANIIWHLYKECRNDCILAFDVDSVLRPTVLRGLDFIGQDNTAVVSFTKKLFVKTVGDAIRNFVYRLRVKRSQMVFSGIYWIYRPYYFNNVNIDGMRAIQNGIDTHMIKQIDKSNTHKILTLKDIGVGCLDPQNEDYPWRQFQDGIWYYVNRHTWIKSKKNNLIHKNSFIIYTMYKILYKFPALVVVLKSVVYCHPWAIRSWMWAWRNQHHQASLAAHSADFDEWCMMGSKYIRGIYDWNAMGRLGTGFE